MALQLFAKG